MNEATAKRMALARRIAPAYAANPKVRAMLLADSVARGTADHFSDVEIDVFWSEPPSKDELRVPIERAGATLLYRAADENECRRLLYRRDQVGKLRERTWTSTNCESSRPIR